VVVRLGSVVLAAVLLGVPRALDARAFGVQRSVYIDVAPQAPELLNFAVELERAIATGTHALVTRRSEATLVVELLSVSGSTGADGRAMEAASFSLREGPRTRSVVLHYRPGQRAEAARRLIESLSSSDA
jgi:hypothetical protein